MKNLRQRDGRYINSGGGIRPWAIVLLAVIGVAICIAMQLVVREKIVQAFKIPSGSMEPTVLVGDHILADKTPAARSPNRGDVIIFKYPEDPTKDFLKRVVAVGGDTVEVRDKVLFINGSPAKDEYAVHLETDHIPAAQNPRDNFGPVKVPPDSYFTMGDNRDRAYDSRFWGFVPKENIKGKATQIYWSWNAKQQKVRWERIGKEIR